MPMSDDVLSGQPHREMREFDRPPADPVALLCAWLDEAVAGHVVLPQAMVLATRDREGAPTTRTVAVKRWDARGLVFGSNLSSRKADHLARDPRAAGTFHWPQTMQQINVAGRVEHIEAHESDELFLERPEAARATAVVSEQSAPLDDEAALRTAAGKALRSGATGRRPSWWGGLRLVPDRIEFWQGGRDRLHRRLDYRRDDGHWSWRRLQP